MPKTPKTPRRHGPPKETIQKTLRLDLDLNAQLEALVQQTGIHYTDLIERGIVLAIEEHTHEIPLLTTQVRYLVANATKAQQVHFRRFSAFLVSDEIAELSEADRRVKNFILHYLELFETRYSEAAAIYAKFRKPDNSTT